MRIVHTLLLTLACGWLLMAQDEPAQPQSLQILTQSPDWQQASVGRPWMLRLQAQGGTPPYQWAVVEGALPPGIRVIELSTVMLGADPGAGFYGSASDSGQWTATLRVTDSAGAEAVAPLSLVVSPLSLAQPAMTLSANKAAAWQLGVSAGSAPYTFRLGDGGYPPLGCELGVDGAFRGTPVIAGEYLIPVEVIDAGGLVLRTTVDLSIYGEETSVPALPLRLSSGGMSATVQVPALPSGVQVQVHWGDGASDTLADVAATHTYEQPGEMTLQAVVTNQDSGEQASAQYSVVLSVPDQPASVAQPRSLSRRSLASPSTLSLGIAFGLW